jgi:hypothetical protein
MAARALPPDCSVPAGGSWSCGPLRAWRSSTRTVRRRAPSTAAVAECSTARAARAPTLRGPAEATGLGARGHGGGLHRAVAADDEAHDHASRGGEGTEGTSDDQGRTETVSR